MATGLTKEQVAQLFIVSTGLMAGAAITNLIASAIGISLTSSFCKNNTKICNHYSNPSEANHNVTMPEVIKNTALNEGLASTFTALLMYFLVLLCFLILTWIAIKCCEKSICRIIEKNKNNENEKNSLLNNHKKPNKCSIFFKKCKEDLIPDPSVRVGWVMMAISAIVNTIYSTNNFANAAKNSICNTLKNSTTKCDFFFPNTTQEQLSMIDHTATTVFNSIMGSGIAFGIVINLFLIAGLALAVGYCRNRCSSAAESECCSIPPSSRFDY